MRKGQEFLRADLIFRGEVRGIGVGWWIFWMCGGECWCGKLGDGGYLGREVRRF